MASHLRPGAYLQGTTTPIKAADALKRDENGVKHKWVCPFCNEAAVLCKGDIKDHYFRHPPESTCYFFKRGGHMSHQHLGAQKIMKNLLESDRPITFLRDCEKCGHSIRAFELNARTPTMCSRMEEPFLIHGKRYSADVALLENDAIQLLVEVYWAHKTCRPDHAYPWVEIRAEDILEITSDGPLVFECIRSQTCQTCIGFIECKRQAAENAKAIEDAKAAEAAIDKIRRYEESMASWREQRKMFKEDIRGRENERKRIAAVEQLFIQKKEKRLADAAIRQAAAAEEILRIQEQKRQEDIEDTIKRKAQHELALRQAGKTELMNACEEGNVDHVTELLASGDADLNSHVLIYGHLGWTAMMFACWKGHTEIVSLLLHAGARINKICGRDDAMSIAEYYNQTDIVELLRAVEKKV